MIPDLGVNSAPVEVQPPRWFRPLRGEPRNVRLVADSWTVARGDTVARQAGLRYESKVQQRLREWHASYIPSPRINFEDDAGPRFIIPDGLLSLAGRTYIFEVKSQHMPEAWWQLEKIYRPVLQARRPQCPITCVEICRSYDPAMPFPGKFHIYDSIDEVLAPIDVWLGVLPWRM